jgi:hypothetical protein
VDGDCDWHADAAITKLVSDVEVEGRGSGNPQLPPLHRPTFLFGLHRLCSAFEVRPHSRVLPQEPRHHGGTPAGGSLCLTVTTQTSLLYHPACSYYV